MGKLRTPALKYGEFERVVPGQRVHAHSSNRFDGGITRTLAKNVSTLLARTSASRCGVRMPGARLTPSPSRWIRSEFRLSRLVRHGRRVITGTSAGVKTLEMRAYTCCFSLVLSGSGAGASQQS